MSRAFPSKKDGWLLVLMSLGMIIGVGVTVLMAIKGDRRGILIGLAACGLFILMYGLLVFPMRYTVGERELEVRFGVVRVRIPYEAITRVSPTRNPLSAPALSLDRLSIEYRKGKRSTFVLISPEPKLEFVAELERASGLTREGDALVRT